jgi:hypothetical protein
MVLTQNELVGALQHEVNILQHLCTKIEPSMLDYRPTPKQRSTLELLQYMVIMGPNLVTAVKTGNFDGPTWETAQATAKAMNLDQCISAIQKQSDEYARTLGAWTEADFRGEIDMFGRKSSRGSILVNLVLSGYAAYRTQLFCYLKSCGRDELNTMNLWAGMDGSMAAS